VSLLRGALFLVGLAALAGLLMGLVYAPKDGVLTAAFLAACGLPSMALTLWLTRHRERLGSLSRQLAVGVSLAVGLVLVGVGAVAALMFVSPHDAFTMALLLGFAGAMAGWCAVLLTRGVLRDVEAVRDGLVAVGQGQRSATIDTSARDELAELAAAANAMTQQLAEGEGARDAAEAARRKLVAAVSHDLRTPLTSLRLLADAVEDEVVDGSTRRRYLGQMSLHIDSLSALVEDLFELSRIEAGDIEWSMRRVHLGELVEETVEAMRAQADAKRVEVHAAIPDGLAPAQANPEQLQRVLFNLIQNAIRHTPADGSVTVAALANGATVELEVADTGLGIDPQERERVFEPFFRGGNGAARTADGSGLGLTICRAIVEAHGGRIWLADTHQGTCVRFSLPQGA